MEASELRKWYGKRIRLTTSDGTFDGVLNYSVQEDQHPSLGLDGDSPDRVAHWKLIDPATVTKVEDLHILEHSPEMDPTEVHRTPESTPSRVPQGHDASPEAKRAANLAPITGNSDGGSPFEKVEPKTSFEVKTDGDTKVVAPKEPAAGAPPAQATVDPAK